MEHLRTCEKCGKDYLADHMRYMNTCKECQADARGYRKWRHQTHKKSRLTIQDIMDLNRKAGQHWFDKDTMGFFKSKVPQSHVGLVKNKYFISSEKSPWDARKYSIREWRGKTKDIETVGEFGAYKTKAQAERNLKKLIRGIMKT